jgi:hypothetical protein
MLPYPTAKTVDLSMKPASDKGGAGLGRIKTSGADVLQTVRTRQRIGLPEPGKGTLCRPATRGSYPSLASIFKTAASCVVSCQQRAN